MTRATAASHGHRAEAPHPHEAPHPRREAFLALSARLTGFDEYDLHGTGLVDAHLATVERQVGAGYLGTLLDDAPAPDADIRTAVCGAITKLWYVGAWFALPDAVFAALNAKASGLLAPNVTAIPSSGAYLEGLVWRAFGGHPMGGKPTGFGSWAMPPNSPEVEV